MIDIGKNRECFFDDYLIDPEKTTAEFRVHNPVYRGPVMTHSEFWEGDGCDSHNFFYDDGIWRMYYLGWKMLDANDGIAFIGTDAPEAGHMQGQDDRRLPGGKLCRR